MPQPPTRRRVRYEVANQPRFLTFSCYQRLALFNNDKIKAFFVQELDAARQTLSFDLIAWVIMPEHVHLLLTPDLPAHTVPQILETIKTNFARIVIARWRSMNAPILNRLTRQDGKAGFWQRGGGYDRNIRDEDELREKCDYIHNNPCKRLLVDSPLAWPWSSARYFAGQTNDVLEM